MIFCLENNLTQIVKTMILFSNKRLKVVKTFHKLSFHSALASLSYLTNLLRLIVISLGLIWGKIIKFLKCFKEFILCNFKLYFIVIHVIIMSLSGYKCFYWIYFMGSKVSEKKPTSLQNVYQYYISFYL